MTTDDDFLARIGRFNDARGGGVLVERRQGGYTLHHEASGAPIARLRPTGRADTVIALYRVWLWERIKSGEISLDPTSPRVPASVFIFI